MQEHLSEAEYRGLLAPMLEEHGVEAAKRMELLQPLGEFMKVVEGVKTSSYVHALQIESFVLTPQWNKDDYSDAIVNIFTRLNTAGRTLTREEITLAWLKIGWVPSQTDGKPAGACLDELKIGLADRGFKVETDEIVRLISFLWAVDCRNGALLDSRDLLKGDIVRSLAGSVSCAWSRLKPRLERGADLIKEQELVENQGSFNAIIVFLTWYRLVFDRCEELCRRVSVVEGDSLEKAVSLRASRFLNRWVFGSQWANVWGDGATSNFQNFASDLSACRSRLAECDENTLLTAVDGTIAQLMDRISTKAGQEITTLFAKDRRRVHAYYSLLWVWHRLEEGRWKVSSVPMRTGRRRTSRLDVDHTVAYAWWQRLVQGEVDKKLTTFTGTDEERASLAPDGFDSRPEADEFINLLGNCSLLDKSFNISRSDASMWSFLEQVHEFKEGIVQRYQWEQALSLSETLTSPDESTFAEIVVAIQSRDSLIRRGSLGRLHSWQQEPCGHMIFMKTHVNM